MSNRALWSAFLVAGLLVVAASVVAAQETGPQPWLHVQVTGEDDGAENVAVNVPCPRRNRCSPWCRTASCRMDSSAWRDGRCR